VLIACNLTPLPRTNHCVGVPTGGVWRELLNSDAKEFGGAGWGNMGSVQAAPLPVGNQPYSLTLTLPPLSTLMLRPIAND
jgi:1,4-alpha-glucan branching enzyme